jgi:hypothetical protein
VDPLLESYKNQLPYFNPLNFENVFFQSARVEDYTGVEQYDIVFSLNVINHVTDIKKATGTLYNSCKTGGKLVLSADAHNFTFLKTVFRFLHIDILHPHQFTLNEYKSLLENTGFEILGNKCLKKGFIFDYIVFVAKKS